MRRATAGLLVLLVLLGTGIAGALDGDPPTSAGWWSRNPGASAQPDGGFEVAAIGGQPVSVAAVRFSVPSGVTRATLTLQETGGFVTPASGVQVCKTTEAWQPANPGAYDEAPTADCAAPVALTRDADALVWSAEVVGLLPSLGGEASLMIVPSESAGGGSPLDPGYQVTFSEAALAVIAAPGTTMAPSTTFAPPSSPSFSGGSDGGGSTFSPPGPATTPTTVPVTPDTVPVDEQPQSGEAFQPPSLAGGATPGGGGDDRPWAKLFVLVPLSAIIGAATVYGKRILQQRGVLEEA